LNSLWIGDYFNGTWPYLVGIMATTACAVKVTASAVAKITTTAEVNMSVPSKAY